MGFLKVNGDVHASKFKDDRRAERMWQDYKYLSSKFTRFQHIKSLEAALLLFDFF